MTLLFYICKVFVCSGVLYGYYWFFLRNKQFHRYNRFYLLGIMLLSVFLPFFKIPVFYKPQNKINQVVFQTIDAVTVDDGVWKPRKLAEDSFLNGLFTWETGLTLFYILGSAILLFGVMKSLLYVRKISKRYKYEFIEELRFYNTREPGTPFSFFRSIFWNDQLDLHSKSGQQVFRHELFHVRQQHSMDILSAELITAICWFNPFFHLIKKELKAIHEFLADQYALSGSDRYLYAELLLQHMLAANTEHPVNYFFQNQIKRRIAMITQLNRGRYSYLRRMMVLPISIFLFCCITLYANQPSGKKILPAAKISAGEASQDNDTIPGKRAKKEQLPGQDSLNGKIKEETREALLNELKEKMSQLQKMQEEIKELVEKKLGDQLGSELKQQLERQEEFKKMQKEKMELLEQKMRNRQGSDGKLLQEKLEDLEKMKREKDDIIRKKMLEEKEIEFKLLQEKNEELEKMQLEKMEMLKKQLRENNDGELKFLQERQNELKKIQKERMEMLKKQMQENNKAELKELKERTEELKKIKLEKLEMEKKQKQESKKNDLNFLQKEKLPTKKILEKGEIVKIKQPSSVIVII